MTYPSGTHVVFTAPGSATSGQYGLFEWNMTGAEGGASPHFHKTFSESFRENYFQELAEIRSSGRTLTDADYVNRRGLGMSCDHTDYATQTSGTGIY